MPGAAVATETTEPRQASTVVTGDTREAFVLAKLGMSGKEDPPEVTEAVAETEEKVTPEAATVEKVTEATDEESAEDKAAREADEKKAGEDTEHKEKVKNSYIKLREARNTARAEAEAAKAANIALEARLKALESGKPADAPTEATGAPDPAKYTDAFKYAEDLSEWKSARAAEAAINKFKQEQAADAEKDRQAKVTATWNSRLAEAKKEIADFDEVIEDSGVQVSDQVRDAIIDSDIGPQILYHLAENPEEATRIGAMTVPAALRAIGKLEAKLEKPAAKVEEVKPVVKEVVISKAPAPITPLKGANVPIDSDGENLDFQKYRKLRKAGKIR